MQVTVFFAQLNINFLSNQHLLDWVFVNAGVEHGVGVDGEFCGDALQEAVEVAHVFAAVVGEFFQVL